MSWPKQRVRHRIAARRGWIRRRYKLSKKYKTKTEMAKKLKVGTADTWKLTEHTVPFIDPQARSIVQELNKRGLKTFYSCQGHKGTVEGYTRRGYIVYEVDPCVNQAFRRAGFVVTKPRHGKLKDKKVMHAEIRKDYDNELYKDMWKNAYKNIKVCEVK